LYDPPLITLKPGVTYSFKEGDLLGRGQSFMSGYTYFQHALLGKN
jgi:hypothetical protein